MIPSRYLTSEDANPRLRPKQKQKSSTLTRNFDKRKDAPFARVAKGCGPLRVYLCPTAKLGVAARARMSGREMKEESPPSQSEDGHPKLQSLGHPPIRLL